MFDCQGDRVGVPWNLFDRLSTGKLFYAIIVVCKK
jgi:hypothetical protein